MTKKKLCFRWILFGGYLLLLSYFLFFAEIMGRTNLTRTYHYNLVPFLEIKRFIIYRKKLGMTAVVVNLIGNIAAFLPFGFFLPFLSQKNRSFAYVTLISFEFSLLIECIQLVSKVGSFDVDDMILNTLGGSLGYLCFWVVRKWKKRRNEKKEE